MLHILLLTLTEMFVIFVVIVIFDHKSTLIFAVSVLPMAHTDSDTKRVLLCTN